MQLPNSSDWSLKISRNELARPVMGNHFSSIRKCGSSLYVELMDMVRQLIEKFNGELRHYICFG